MSSPTQQPDLSSWPTREEAAGQLRRSVATIDRWIGEGRLKSAERPRPGKKAAIVVDPADVARLRPAPPASPAYVVPLSSTTENTTALTTAPVNEMKDRCRWLRRCAPSRRRWLNLNVSCQ